MDFTTWTAGSAVHFLFIVFRCFAVLYPLPYMEAVNVNNRMKAGLSFFLAIFLYPFAPAINHAAADSLSFIVMGVTTELLIGVSLTFIVKVFFGAVQYGGNAAGMQMGLGMAQGFDPTAKTSLSLFAGLMSRITVMLMLVLNLDHFFIKALHFSLKAVPVGGFSPEKSIFYWLTALGTTIPATAFQIVVPIVTVIFLIQTAFGLVSKSVPQINIFFISSIVTIFLGLGVFALSMPYLFTFVEENFARMNDQILHFLRSLNV